MPLEFHQTLSPGETRASAESERLGRIVKTLTFSAAILAGAYIIFLYFAASR